MTATWDVVQEYLAALAKVEDPAIFATGIQYLIRLFVEIHEVDDRTGERFNKALWEKPIMKEIRRMVKGKRPRERP